MAEVQIAGLDHSTTPPTPREVDVAADGSVLVRGANIQVAAKAPIAPSSLIASAALPAAGAWTSATPYAVPAGARRVGFMITYTGAAAGGGVRYRVRKGLSAGSLASEQVIDGTIVPSGSEGAQGTYDAVFKRPITGTSPSKFPLDVDVEGGWTHIVIDLAEYGATGTPGTAGATIAGSY